MEKILIIEDDADIREGVRILLEGEGYAVKRLISTNPAAYLEPELAPGTIIGKF